VDNGTLKVYPYTAAAGRTSGSQNAAATFALNPYDTNPQGIADPLPPGAAFNAGDVPMAETLPPDVGSLPDALATSSVPALSLSGGLVDWLMQSTPVAATSASNSGQAALDATVAPTAAATLSAGRPAAGTPGSTLMSRGTRISQDWAVDQVFADPQLGLTDYDPLR
jgi:hypothetical protein